MTEWLQQIPAERLPLWVFMAGMAWNRIAAHTKSLRGQGRRIGRVEQRIAAIAAKVGITFSEDKRRGDGEWNRPADLELECPFVVEVGKALNVAGDLLVGALRRLRAARTRDELALARAEIARPLRRTLGALAIAVPLLEGGTGDGVAP